MLHFCLIFLNPIYAMPDFDPTCLFVRNPDLVATDMDGDTVMMSIERAEHYGVGGVGSRVWELLESPASITDIVKAICGEFEVNEPTCQADMKWFVEDMQSHGLVSISAR